MDTGNILDDMAEFSQQYGKVEIIRKRINPVNKKFKVRKNK
jgi:hypothetical protein